MNNDLLEQLQQFNKPWFYKLAWIGGTLLFLVSGWLLWNNLSVQPVRVNRGTISNNLVVSGVTRRAISKDPNGSLNQYQQVTLGAQNVVRTAATIEQSPEGEPTTKIMSETIATPEDNFSRYVGIETSQKAPGDKSFDFAPVLNQWGKQPVEAETSGAFSEALFGDLVAFANLPANRRNPIINDMKNNKVYTVDFSAVSKRRENGKLIYDYEVKVAPEQYLKALKQIDEATGLKQLTSLDESQFAGAEAIKFKVSIDAHAQQMVGLSYEGDNRTVTFANYGALVRVDIPTNTVTQVELQTRLNNILTAK